MLRFGIYVELARPLASKQQSQFIICQITRKEHAILVVSQWKYIIEHTSYCCKNETLEKRYASLSNSYLLNIKDSDGHIP